MGRIGRLLIKTSIGDKIVKDRIFKKADVIFVSFPKTGRTWIRVMMVRYLQLIFDLPLDASIVDPMVLKIKYPKIQFNHGDGGNPLMKKYNELDKSKKKFYNKKIILLYREPKDTMVSAYFERTKRQKNYQGSISEFIRNEKGALETFLNYYKIWLEEKNRIKNFHFMKYENVQKNPHEEFKKIMNFLNIKIDESMINDAVDFGSFKNMHKLEKNDVFKDQILRPKNKNDPESFKTRKGKVGGYVEYLDAKDIEYIDNRTKDDLPSLFTES